MSKTLSKEKIQERICQLIRRAEAFLKWSDQLLDLHEKERDSYQNSIKKLIKFDKSPISICIILHQVLYFQEAVIVLNTLLESKRQPTEISFSYYFANAEKNSLENEIDNIEKEFRAAYLRIFRNQFFAHKQADSSGDPVIGFLNPVKKEHVKKACSIVKKLRTLTKRNFNYVAAVDNDFEDLYKPGFEFLYRICEAKFKKNRKIK